VFKRIQSAVFRISRVFALIFLTQTAFGFELSSKDLLQKKDYFSLLKKNARYEELNLFLDTCHLKTVKDCAVLGEKIYKDKRYSSFKPVITKKLVNKVSESKAKLSLIDFLDRIFLAQSEVKKIVETFPADQVVNFLGVASFGLHNKAGKILTEKPNLICKFKNYEDLTAPLLSGIVKGFDFYAKDFSDFPCGLKLNKSFKALKAELKKSRSKTKFKKDYLFLFLKKKVSRDAYKFFPRYKKSSFSRRSRLQWKAIKGHLPYIQNRIIKNLFYAGKYKMLSDYVKLSKRRKPNLEPESLVYIVKSLAGLQMSDELLKLSTGLEWKSARWTEETLLMRAAAFLRKGDFESARVELSLLTKHTENLRLSSLYWKWVSYKKEKNKKEAKAAAEDLLQEYPFTYYGLRVAKDLYGATFFKRYMKTNHVTQSFSKVLTKSEIEILSYFYVYEKRNDFKKAYFQIKAKLNPKQKSLMSLAFANLDHQIEVIRALNKVWDEEQGLRADPFVETSFPLSYADLSREVSQKLKWVSPSLIHAVIRQESAFNEKARSSASAMGLMQLLPSTAKEVARRSKNKTYKKRKDLFKPQVNITLGANYLNRLINASEGYLPYAFASYNAGPGRMYKWSKGREDVKGLRKGFVRKTFDPLDDLWVEELPWSETRFYTKALLRNTGIYLALMNEKEALKCAPFWRCHRDSL